MSAVSEINVTEISVFIWIRGGNKSGLIFRGSSRNQGSKTPALSWPGLKLQVELSRSKSPGSKSPIALRYIFKFKKQKLFDQKSTKLKKGASQRGENRQIHYKNNVIKECSKIRMASSGALAELSEVHLLCDSVSKWLLKFIWIINHLIILGSSSPRGSWSRWGGSGGGAADVVAVLALHDPHSVRVLGLCCSILGRPGQHYTNCNSLSYCDRLFSSELEWANKEC